MRTFITCLAALLTAALVLAGIHTARAADDPLAELHQAAFLDVHDMEAVIPHGSLTVADGIVASFRGVDQRTAGIMLGDIELVMSNLPEGPGALNLFAELYPDQRVVRKQADRAFYSVAFGAGSQVQPGMYITALKTWDDLSAEEQARFESVYLQAYSDAWIEEAGHGGGGHPGGGGHWGAGGQPETVGNQVKVRFPVGRETYAAVWTTDGDRWDYRIDATGRNVTVEDYYRNITYVQEPWAPTEGDLDPALRFGAIEYYYSYWASEADGGPGEMHVDITAEFTVSEPRTRLELISYPWLEIESVQNELAQDLAWERGGTGYSDWSLFVDGDFQPGNDYELRISAGGTVPETYSGIGYAGVYRFDTVALWPGEDHPVDITIKLAIEENGWDVTASGSPADYQFFNMGGPGGGYGPLRDEAEATWPGCTRNQMLVATMFPAATIPTDWGELKVYAPADLAADVTGMESITALGEIIGYYNSLWGDRGITTQPVFLVPGEHGVQAFEDAGLIFILGGDRTGIPLIAHETAHLWWGYDVGSPRWFYEGMANYSAAKLLEHYYGDGGPAAGQGDPLFYRRYIMNFSLGYELPLSFDRRDELDDTAAVYHNSAAFLLTMDAMRPYGIDGILRLIHEAGLNAPAIGSAELRDIFADQSGGELGEVWDAYAVRGEIPHVAVDDETFRRFEFTPAREDYVRMLRWLTPAYRKQAIGDYMGALYCADRALEFRSETKDYVLLAELTYKAGRLDEAWERCAALLENPATDAKNAVKLHWLLSQVYRAQGQEDSELLELDVVIADGPAEDLLYLVQQAQARRAEITGEAPPEPVASGMPAGHPGGHPGG